MTYFRAELAKAIVGYWLLAWLLAWYHYGFKRNCSVVLIQTFNHSIFGVIRLHDWIAFRWDEDCMTRWCLDKRNGAAKGTAFTMLRGDDLSRRTDGRIWAKDESIIKAHGITRKRDDKWCAKHTIHLKSLLLERLFVLKRRSQGTKAQTEIPNRSMLERRLSSPHDRCYLNFSQESATLFGRLVLSHMFSQWLNVFSSAVHKFTLTL